MVATFTIGWVLMYADRTILNPVMPHLAKEFNLTNAELGLVNSVFFIAYAIAQIPSGTLGDKIGRRKVLVPGFVLFGLLTGASGLATTFLIFLIIRFVTGLGEGTYFGPAYAVSTDNIPKKYLTMGTAIINSGMALGISLGYLLSSYFTLELGMSWRIPFYLMTIPTLIVAGIIWLTLRPRPELKDITKEPSTEKVNIWEQLKNRNVIAILIMVFCSLYGFFMIITWLPQYLQVERGFLGSEVGYISSLVPWASIPAAILFGIFSDRLGRRKPLIIMLVPVAIVSVWAVAFVDSNAVLITALLVYGFTGKLALDPVLISFMASNVSKRAYATMFSIYNFVGMLSSILAPYITGYLLDVTGNMAIGFILAMIMMAIGLLAILFTKEKQVEAIA
ncbi:MFS transporter [Bacillus sp. Bva_UNVM-123]|uniref:MFS transporter n=1 Tax=Bacillus sp. Bva_UNVM-123 TaxID=2829798 RepID=UPI00391F2FD0